MSPFGAVPIRDIVLALAFASVLLAAVGTWLSCLLLLRAYRRQVDRGMRSDTSPDGPAPAASSPPLAGPGELIAIREAVAAGALPVLAVARGRARRFLLAFTAAGLAYGSSATAAYFFVDGGDWQFVRALAYVVLFAWPLLPTVLAVSMASPRTRWLLSASYGGLALGLLALARAGLGEALVIVLVPALFIFALGARPLRGAAWLVAPALAVSGAAAGVLYLPGVYLVVRAPFDRYAWSALLAGVALLVLLVAYAWAITRSYAAKWVSDQTLLILQWWLVASLWLCLLLGTQGGAAALLGLAPYGVLVLVLGVAAATGRPEPAPPVRLLLLRTFGARQRSSRLLYDLTRRWRWIGSVELITGTDLATEILEPDEFLDFLLGRTGRRFVAEAASLPDRLDELDLRPDRDGRYRVNELLCQADTWHPAVEGLLSAVDVVLMDLRGLTVQHAGVVQELELVVGSMPLPRVVALVDDTTDRQVLQWAVDRGARLAPSSGPLARDPEPVLRVVVVRGRLSDELPRLMSALAEAAAPDHWLASR
jgi:hypothetical protein